MVGFFTGWINFYGWMFDLAALIQITANVSVNLYVVYHQDTYVYNAWQVYIAYLIICWVSALVVILANRLVPLTQKLGMFFVIVGGLVTIIVVAAMPARHASSQFVWNSFDENNVTGWSGGVAFLCGVLNGAFTIGTPDAITHMAEELPRPRTDLPKAIALQIGLGFLYAFVFAITIMYAITDLSVLTAGINTYPLANIYAQATTSASGEQNLGAQFGLLFIVWCSSILCCIGTTVTVSYPRHPAYGSVRTSGRRCPFADLVGVRVFRTHASTGLLPATMLCPSRACLPASKSVCRVLCPRLSLWPSLPRGWAPSLLVARLPSSI